MTAEPIPTAEQQAAWELDADIKRKLEAGYYDDGDALWIWGFLWREGGSSE